MWAGFLLVVRLAAQHWVWLGTVVCLGSMAWLLARETRIRERDRRSGLKAREELEAYTQLDTRVPGDGNMRELARQVSWVMAEKSAFRRTAVLVRDSRDRLELAGSRGMDDQTEAALEHWCNSVEEAERGGDAQARRGDGGLGIRLTLKSFAVVLGKGLTGPGCGRAIVTPMWTAGGRMVGALVVCADGLLSVRRSAVSEALAGIEALAAKLGRSIENAALAERLLKAEKLAGLGLLAGGVAHALNNPLTAVLGYAELIAHTTAEPRVQEDAETIVREAKRMRQTVESLTNYWQPAADSDEVVEIRALLEELSEACTDRLEARGMRLVVEAGDDLPAIRGNKERLRQVVEHLLNNAAQAVAAAKEMGVVAPLEGDGKEHSIRVTVSHDERMLHLIVSDTGPGFREPGRVFDPSYPVGQAGDGAGLGLSLCYGIVREHGGEISAFNLQPHGAAVMVELPVEGVAGNPADAAREVA